MGLLLWWLQSFVLSPISTKLHPASFLYFNSGRISTPESSIQRIYTPRSLFHFRTSWTFLKEPLPIILASVTWRRVGLGGVFVSKALCPFFDLINIVARDSFVWFCLVKVPNLFSASDFETSPLFLPHNNPPLLSLTNICSSRLVNILLLLLFDCHHSDISKDYLYVC